jgi:hypothetical protein
MGLFLGASLFRWQIGPGGIGQIDHLNLGASDNPWFAGQLRLDRELIHYSSGHVFDPAARGIVAKYPIGGMANRYDYPGRVGFSGDGGRLWFTSSDGESRGRASERARGRHRRVALHLHTGRDEPGAGAGHGRHSG